MGKFTNSLKEFFDNTKDPKNYKDGGKINLSDYFSKEAESINSIVKLQTQLSFDSNDIKLNVDIDYKKKNESYVFEINGPNNSYFLMYEYITTEVEDFDLFKLKEFYVKDMLTNVNKKTIYSTYSGNNDAFVITGKYMESKQDHFSFIVIEGANLSTFTISAKEDMLFMNPTIAYKIFASYKFIKQKNLNKRIKKEFLCFSADSELSLFSDYVYQDGYLVSDDEEDSYISSIGVFESETRSLKESLELDNIDVKKITLTFNGVNVEAEYCLNNQEGKKYLEYFFEYKRKYFRIRIIPTDSKKEEFMKCLNNDEKLIETINSKFDRFFFFNF